MNLGRQDFADHLRRISCRGQIKEAVFSGAFGTQAVTPDRLLLVIAPPFDGNGLPEDVGVTDLDLMIKSLSIVPGGEDDIGVDVTYEDNRIVITEEGRGRVRLLTAAPRQIATRIDPEMVKKVTALIGTTTVGLDRTLLEGVASAYSTLKATEVEVVVGPKGGVIRVGDPNSNMAEFPSDDLKTKEPFTLNFGEQFLDVLGTISTDAIMYLAGPGQAAAIQDGEYMYILSPRSYTADRKVPTATATATKKRGGKKKASEAAEPAEPAPAEAEA